VDLKLSDTQRACEPFDVVHEDGSMSDSLQIGNDRYETDNGLLVAFLIEAYSTYRGSVELQ
jgi:hypothetical protein